MKILERIVDGLIRQLVSVDDSQFDFVPGRGTTDAIFVVRQLQEKYLAANKRLYMAFVDLEKDCDRVPRKVIWWALRKLGMEEWIVWLVQGMCPCWWGVQWRVWSEGWCSPRISNQPAALHHCAWSLITRVPLWGPLGGPLCRWHCYHRWIAWGMCQEALDLERSNGEERIESKCRKNKDHDLRYGTEPPAEFRRVSMCRLSHWSGQQQHILQWLQALGAQEMQWAQALDKKPWLQIYTVLGNCMPLGWQITEGSPGRTWQAWGGSFFCYLGDMLSAAGGCELSTTTCVKTAWKKFKDLLPVLSSCHLSFKTRGRVYSSCVRSAMLHASETWPLTKPNLQRLQRNDRAMIRQVCNVRPQDIVTTRSNELLVRLDIEDLDLILKERRLQWYGHVEHSNGAVKTAFDVQVDRKRGPGRPKMTWKQLAEQDCREWKLSAINPHDRHTWRSGVRSAMRAASQLSGRGPTDVDVAPVAAR